MIGSAIKNGLVVVGGVLAVPEVVAGAKIIGGAASIGCIGKGAYDYMKNRSKNAQEQLQKGKKEAKQKKDPKHYKRCLEETHQNFMTGLKNIDLTQQIKKKDNLKDIVFIGATSSGKTSLINCLFKTKLQIGLGVTTSQVTLASHNQQRRIYDGVGQNTDFECYDYQQLLFFHAMDVIFIVYRSSPKTIQYLIKVLCLVEKKRYKVIFVRTACDEWTSQHGKTVDEEVATDYKILESFGVKKPRILRSSAKGGFDNEEILKSC